MLYDTSSLIFLSTLSLRRATPIMVREPATSNFYPRSPCGERPGCQRLCERPTTNFYPRSPCGERPILGSPRAGCPAISIHALLAESDLKLFAKRFSNSLFLSTLSLRRATSRRFQPFCQSGFLSTLSLRRATSGHR